jgi:hypothetical protein
MTCCISCLKDLPSSSYRKHPWRFAGRQSKCIDCQSNGTNPEAIKRRVILRTRYSAKQRRLLHTITSEDFDLPLLCPLLGIKLDYSRSRTRGSNRFCLDRIDNRLGYVPGNVHIISLRANRLKGELTPEQLINFAKQLLHLFSR